MELSEKSRDTSVRAVAIDTQEHRRGYSEDVKLQALAMYLEGLGFRSIGRLLSCSHTAAYYWIR
jgi:transposase-like protein